MSKILALQAALRCFACGLLGLLPVVGIAFALAAVLFHSKAAGHAPDGWDVARRYTRLGIGFAVAGLLLNITGVMWFALAWAEKQL